MRKFVLAAVLVLMAGGAQAATLNVVGGQLMGASDVLVDGNLYDVQFLDGTCIDLYDGCDEVSDFTFQTVASAILASQALIDQVFLDVPEGAFGSQMNLINGLFDPNFRGAIMSLNAETVGCIYPTQCLVFVDLGISSVPAWNVPNRVIGPLAQGAWGSFTDTDPLTSTYSGATWLTHAVWQPIPEPNTALLLSLGLTGLAARRRSLRS